MTEDARTLADVEELERSALGLAAARYGRDHPEAAATAREWAGSYAGWVRQDAEAFTAEAERLRLVCAEILGRVEEAGPEVAGPLRPRLLQAELALGSAAGGHFGTASGQLTEFLNAVGAGYDGLSFS